MAFSLRPRTLDCFYCGSKSAQKHQGTVRKWHCEHCEAVNYLDNNGQITDPPAYSSAVSTPPAPRFAYAPTRSTSPPSISQDNLFCNTCIKNQQLLIQTLASYLPATSDPHYKEYETSYPAYRTKLEQRYPQVCARCLPGVRERIRRAGYVAKTDHLRRMVEQTRLGGVRKSRGLGWRGVILSLGGLGWFTSFLVQILWHAMGILKPAKQKLGSLRVSNPSISFLQDCFQQVARDGEIQASCLSGTINLVQISLVLGIITVWWNNKLRRKYESRSGRMFRLKDYYLLQVLILIVRGTALAVLPSRSYLGLSSMGYRGAHTFMTVFLVFCAVVSKNVIKFDQAPLVTFHGDLALPSLPEESQNSIETKSRSPLKVGNPGAVTPAHFPIPSLSPATPYQIPNFSPQRPPTPPLEDDEISEVDAMDWTPSNKHTNFQPRSPLQAANPKRSTLPSQSPFYGSLPKAPIPPSYKLRNPVHSSQPFRKASKSAQETFSAGMNTSSARIRPLSSRTSTATSLLGDSNDNDDASIQTERAEFSMAPPKFFLEQDRLETGLEAWFDEVFTIRDEPKDLNRQGTLSSGSVGTVLGPEKDFNSEDHPQSETRSLEWGRVLTVILGPLCILGGAIMILKGLS